MGLCALLRNTKSIKREKMMGKSEMTEKKNYLSEFAAKNGSLRRTETDM